MDNSACGTFFTLSQEGSFLHDSGRQFDVKKCSVVIRLVLNTSYQSLGAQKSEGQFIRGKWFSTTPQQSNHVVLTWRQNLVCLKFIV